MRKLVALNHYLLIAVCLLSGISPGKASAARGLDINIDVIRLRNIAPGIEINVGKTIAQKIIIKNRSAQARRYSISFHKPSQLGAKWNKRRYREIPAKALLDDKGWFRISEVKRESEKSEIEYEIKAGMIEIPAGSEKEISVYLKIPSKNKYYGRRFCAVMAVSEVPEEGKSGRIILAVYPRINIETKEK
ncbi:MAG: hypothetical protein J7M11_00890 [Elusimicrobia bacterium]|nr:hypothetical protein [Elusimicrobiota bacterium]